MAKELLERRVVEEKKPVTVKLTKGANRILDEYARWANYDKSEVVEALVKTLLGSREFAKALAAIPNGNGKAERTATTTARFATGLSEGK